MVSSNEYTATGECESGIIITTTFIAMPTGKARSAVLSVMKRPASAAPMTVPIAVMPMSVDA